MTVIAFALVLAACAGEEADDADADEQMYLLVASAVSGELVDGVLTLDGIPNVTYFADRPSRLTGQITLPQFMDNWSLGPDSFADVPPNADLSVFDSSGQVVNMVVELSSLELLDSDSIRFTVKVLEGLPPSGAFGAASLFIDDCCNTANPFILCPDP